MAARPERVQFLEIVETVMEHRLKLFDITPNKLMLKLEKAISLRLISNSCSSQADLKDIPPTKDNTRKAAIWHAETEGYDTSWHRTY